LENPTDQKNIPIFFRDIWGKKVEFGLSDLVVYDNL